MVNFPFFKPVWLFVWRRRQINWSSFFTAAQYYFAFSWWRSYITRKWSKSINCGLCVQYQTTTRRTAPQNMFFGQWGSYFSCALTHGVQDKRRKECGEGCEVLISRGPLEHRVPSDLFERSLFLVRLRKHAPTSSSSSGWLSTHHHFVYLYKRTSNAT